LLKKNIIVFDTIHKFEKNKIMSHDNHSHDNHEQGSEYTFFDGGGVSAFGFIFVIIGLAVLAWLILAG
jgi:hypothetical protein